MIICDHLRWGKPFSYHNLHGYRRGGTFDSPKVPKSDLGLRPKNQTHRNAHPESQSDGFPERGLNGAYKVSQMRLPPSNLPRFGGGERPPFSCKPPAPLTITMGQRLIFRPIAVPHPNHRDPPRRSPSTTQNPPTPPILHHHRICVRMRAGSALRVCPRTQATPAENSSPNCEYSLKFTVLLLTNKRSCGTI